MMPFLGLGSVPFPPAQRLEGRCDFVGVFVAFVHQHFHPRNDSRAVATLAKMGTNWGSDFHPRNDSRAVATASGVHLTKGAYFHPRNDSRAVATCQIPVDNSTVLFPPAQRLEGRCDLSDTGGQLDSVISTRATTRGPLRRLRLTLKILTNISTRATTRGPLRHCSSDGRDRLGISTRATTRGPLRRIAGLEAFAEMISTRATTRGPLRQFPARAR